MKQTGMIQIREAVTDEQMEAMKHKFHSLMVEQGMTRLPLVLTKGEMKFVDKRLMNMKRIRDIALSFPLKWS